MKDVYKGCEVDIYQVAVLGDNQAFVIIAKQGYGKTDWRAYCGLTNDATDDDWQAVLEHGSKVNRKLAEFLFPDFAKKYEWRA